MLQAKIPQEVREKQPWKLSDDWAKTFAGLLHDRLWELNKNFIVIFVGETGSGKSYSALAMAEMIDPDFSIDRVVYKPKEFIYLLDKCKRGDVIIFDEAGVGIPAREWQTLQNKIISYVLQTFRYKNVGVFFTTPSMKFIDSQVRVLTHYVVKVYGHKNNMAKCVVFEIDHDPVADVTDYRKWKFVDEERGYEYDPNPIYIGKPSDDLAERYEKLSRQRKEELRKELMKQLESLEEGAKSGIDGRTLRKLKNIAIAFYRAYSILKEQCGSTRQVSRLLGVDPQTLHNWIYWIESNQNILIKSDFASIDE